MALEEKERQISLGDRVWVNGSLVSPDTYDRIWVAVDVNQNQAVHVSLRTIGSQYESQHEPLVVEEPYKAIVPNLDKIAGDPITEITTWLGRKISRNIVEHSYEGNHPYKDIQLARRTTSMENPHLMDAQPVTNHITMESGQSLAEQGIDGLLLRHFGLGHYYSITQVVAIIKNHHLGTANVFWQDIAGEIQHSLYPIERIQTCVYTKEGDETA